MIAQPTAPADPALQIIERKLDLGESLSVQDGVALLSTSDLHTLGRLALAAKERKSGKNVYYVLNRYINSTNVCFAGCKFCSFAADEFKEPQRVFRMTADRGLREGARNRNELQPDPHRRRARSASAVARLLAAADAPLQGERCRTCSSRSSPRPRSTTWPTPPPFVPRDRHARCARPGLDNVNGGGAEVFSERFASSRSARTRSRARTGSRSTKKLHRQGVASNATMLYGHIETLEERVDHFIQLRESQERSPGLQRLHSARVPSRRQRTVVLRLDDAASTTSAPLPSRG